MQEADIVVVQVRLQIKSHVDREKCPVAVM